MGREPFIPDSVGEECWNQFEQTGRVEDYLRYAQSRSAAQSAGEELHANHDRWDCDRNGQFR